MNTLRGAGIHLARNQSTFRLPTGYFYTQTTRVAIRCFSEKNNPKNPLPVSFNPLHDAVKEGNISLVKQILRTDIVEINGLDAAGDLPLVIAAKKYTQEENYPGEILKLLHEYGACYFLDDSKGEEAGTILRQSPNETGRLGVIIRIESFLHRCGLPHSRSTRLCKVCKEESKHYSAEFKARIALESLTTELTSKELAKKHQVEPWEVIKWRWQVREGLVSFFEEK